MARFLHVPIPNHLCASPVMVECSGAHGIELLLCDSSACLQALLALESLLALDILLSLEALLALWLPYLKWCSVSTSRQ